MDYRPRNAARELINQLFQAIWKAIKKLFMKRMILIFMVIVSSGAFAQMNDKSINKSLVTELLIVEGDTISYQRIPSSIMQKLIATSGCKYCNLYDYLYKIDQHISSLSKVTFIDYPNRGLGCLEYCNKELSKEVEYIKSLYPGLNLEGYTEAVSFFKRREVMIMKKIDEYNYNKQLKKDMAIIEASTIDSLAKVRKDSIYESNLEKENQIRAENQKEWRLVCIKNYGIKMGNLVADKKVVFGMTIDMCEDAWGAADKRSDTKLNGVTITTLFFGRYSERWLTFKNGKLVQKME